MYATIFKKHHKNRAGQDFKTLTDQHPDRKSHPRHIV